MCYDVSKDDVFHFVTIMSEEMFSLRNTVYMYMQFDATSLW